ncbi:hypothetical protein ATE92_1176 [Ulvibacter sp. MAR_2010_11]|uniref:hypothetical protein n=1 Tax=Ulvibacter sp. MAR_2010_11 TaxID=1250229 RepID=UPI000C2BD6AA|nr:hypothetical protein [Ulvibacter sp. MAR_2010_11]PKA83030.1 hypothetical protein ATE92_1176 [Ulvibacter sp. MAR_2010_11]
MRQLSFLLILAVICSCNKNNNDDGAIFCTEEFVYGLQVTVRDANTSAVLTAGEVTVTVTDGNYSETLEFFDTVFLGAGERAGNYIITISGSNYQTFNSNTVTVSRTEDDCHVITEVLAFTVQPN